MSATSQPVVERAVGLQIRRDLEMVRLRCGRQWMWNVKDPASLRYFQLREEEHFILTNLDGRHSLRELKELTETRFRPQKLEIAQLESFVGLLHRQGLILADAPGQSDVLLERRRQLRRQNWISQLANPLAIRFRGIDPSRLLDRVYPRVRWLFQRGTFGCLAAALLAAILLLVSHAEELAASLPGVQAFLSVANIGLLAVALFAVKFVHEAAHALTCRHFQAECHEAGVMLLVGVPCLYCNISDAWMLPNKWQRITISAAGICMELAIASVCVAIWAFTGPGLLNAMSFNLLVVCSVSTLLLNGNPLLRFDGYFVLADLIDTPNLWQNSNRLVREWAARWCLGVETHERPPVSAVPGWFLRAYGLASLVYRTLVIFAILWVCLRFFERHGLSPVGHLIVSIALLGIGLSVAGGGWRKFKNPSWRKNVKKSSLAVTAAVVMLLGVGVLWIPVPQTVRAPITLLPVDAERVYVTRPGQLVWAVQAGTYVRKGDPLAILRDPELEWEASLAAGRLSAQNLLVNQLKRRQIRDPQAAVELSDAEALRQAMATQQSKRQTNLDELTIIAPRTGQVISPRYRRADSQPGELDTWTATPLEPDNLGCYLEADTELCLVGDPEHLEAQAVVGQSRIETVRKGQPVRLQIDCLPGSILAGRVAELDTLELDTAAPELIATRKLAVTPDGTPARPSYRVKLALLDPPGQLRVGATGTALIQVRRETLGQRAWRTLRETLFRPSDRLRLKESAR